MRTPASGPAAEEAVAGSLLLDPGIADQLAPQVALLAHEAGEVLRRARERVEAQRGQALAGLGPGDDRLIAALSRATTRAAVRPGRSKQEFRSKSGTPDSAMEGRSGTMALRCAVDTASARNWPDCTKGRPEARSVNKPPVRRPRRSGRGVPL